ncbi:MAG: hypothetical protein JWQ87_483 [Candidatus Sulfotelmatobacter sp.]|nr:hypothetical protein [Candidatus Sulfotelmatobacter sp.]
MRALSNIGTSFVTLLWMTSIVFTLACGTGNSQIRLLNASPGESSLTASVGGTSIATTVNYGTASSYISVPSGSATLAVEAAGTTSLLINASITLSSNTSYTVLAGNYSSAINATILSDDNTTPASGNVSIRLVNASPTLGTADVYVLAPGSSLSSATPVVTSLNFESASSYQSLSAGNYEVYFTQPGQKSAVIDSGPLTLTSQQIRTVVGLDGESGGYETAVLSDLN